MGTLRAKCDTCNRSNRCASSAAICATLNIDRMQTQARTIPKLDRVHKHEERQSPVMNMQAHREVFAAEEDGTDEMPVPVCVVVRALHTRCAGTQRRCRTRPAAARSAAPPPPTRPKLMPTTRTTMSSRRYRARRRPSRGEATSVRDRRAPIRSPTASRARLPRRECRHARPPRRSRTGDEKSAKMGTNESCHRV